MIYVIIVIAIVLAIVAIQIKIFMIESKKTEQSFYPNIQLTGLDGNIYYLDLSKNKYILVLKPFNEYLDVVVYSRSGKKYTEGESTKIISYSDGSYFVE